LTAGIDIINGAQQTKVGCAPFVFIAGVDHLK